jgi:hydroxyacylglutathione hydrolase
MAELSFGRIRLGALALVLAVGAFVWCQPRTRAQELADAASWFKVHQVAAGVWRIDDHGGDNVYLVVGSDRALLIDTGTGAGDLAACVRQITRLPLTVVNTHAHPDHMGGNFQFDRVSAHPDDFAMISHFSKRESGARALERLLPVSAGHVFDLGGQRLEVIETPGHTKGSICLLDAAHKRLFTGDNDNSLVWLFLKDCLPLEAYLKTLQSLQKRGSEYETILPGHGEPIDSAFIGEQIACAESILSGACKGEPYQNTFGIAARVCTHKRASITFDPENLRAK